MRLSVVVPVFNEAESLAELLAEITSALRSTSWQARLNPDGESGLRRVNSGQADDYELLFIDDGSRDGSGDLLRRMADKDSRVKVISLYRNYGKAEALAAGFQASQGDYVVTLDADLQDDPQEIAPLLAKLGHDWDVVSGWKKERHDPFSKRAASRFFNFIVRLFTGVAIHDFNCGLKAYRAEVVKSIDVYGSLHRYIPALAKYKGFRVTEQVVRHRPRQYGRTKYGAARYYQGFLDLLTVLFLGRYTQRPLHFFGLLGIISSLIGMTILGYLTVVWFLGQAIGNRPLFFLGILLFIVGIQFFSLGLIAELLARRRHKEQRVVRAVYPAGRQGGGNT